MRVGARSDWWPLTHNHRCTLRLPMKRGPSFALRLFQRENRCITVFGAAPFLAGPRKIIGPFLFGNPGMAHAALALRCAQPGISLYAGSMRYQSERQMPQVFHPGTGRFAPVLAGRSRLHESPPMESKSGIGWQRLTDSVSRWTSWGGTLFLARFESAGPEMIEIRLTHGSTSWIKLAQSPL